jgi:hypothetical protein
MEEAFDLRSLVDGHRPPLQKRPLRRQSVPRDHRWFEEIESRRRKRQVHSVRVGYSSALRERRYRRDVATGAVALQFERYFFSKSGRYASYCSCFIRSIGMKWKAAELRV